jgi:DNA polymerase-3 subunit beta
MKIAVNQSELQKALHHLSRATPTRSTIPILNRVLMVANNGKLTLRATDLEITIITDIPSTVDKEGSVALPHKTLTEITSALPDVELKISADENSRVQIRAGQGDYDIPGVSAEEFPQLPEVDNKKEVILKERTLAELITKTSFALSTDELKPALMGALFEFGEKSVTAIATDGHRLSVCKRSDYEFKGYSGDIIVPRKFLQLLNQYLGGGEKEDVVLWVGDSHITIAVSGVTIFSRIIDERYPDYHSVLPSDNDRIALFDRKKLLSVVKRVAIFSNRATKQIALHLSKGESFITTEDPESSTSAREEIGVDYDGENMILGYNATYLGNMLSHLDSEKVVLKLKTPISAGLILPDEQAEDEEITMLLMPMRTSS